VITTEDPALSLPRGGNGGRSRERTFLQAPLSTELKACMLAAQVQTDAANPETARAQTTPATTRLRPTPRSDRIRGGAGDAPGPAPRRGTITSRKPPGDRTERDRPTADPRRPGRQQKKVFDELTETTSGKRRSCHQASDLQSKLYKALASRRWRRPPRASCGLRDGGRGRYGQA